MNSRLYSLWMDEDSMASGNLKTVFECEPVLLPVLVYLRVCVCVYKDIYCAGTGVILLFKQHLNLEYMAYSVGETLPVAWLDENPKGK